MIDRLLAVPAVVSLVLAVSCSKHEDPCANPARPAPPDAPVALEPIAMELTSTARVPGAPTGCVGKLFVRASRAACPASETASTDTIPGHVDSSTAADGATCWLSCWDWDDHATWGLAVPNPAFRGSVTCQVDGGGQMTFEVVDAVAGFSDSAGATWLTQIGGDGYTKDMCTGTTYVTKMACPMGEPARATGG